MGGGLGLMDSAQATVRKVNTSKAEAIAKFEDEQEMERMLAISGNRVCADCSEPGLDLIKAKQTGAFHRLRGCFI